MNRKTFTKQVLDNGFVTLDEDGSYNFVATQINDENFDNISPKFKQQLENEGKYNSWIGFVSNKSLPPYNAQMLPIYGDSEKYVTKWFTNTAEGAVEQCLKDRQMGLLKRASNYIEN